MNILYAILLVGVGVWSGQDIEQRIKGRKFPWLFQASNPATILKGVATTVFWDSRGSHHYFSWNGRHRGVLGIEDVTAYSHLGLAASLAENLWKRPGIPPALALGGRKITRNPYIVGVAQMPERFDGVSTIRRIAGIRLSSRSGTVIKTCC